MPTEGKAAVVILRGQVLLGLLCCTGLGFESVMGLLNAEDSSRQIEANISEPLQVQAFAVSFFLWLIGVTVLRTVLAREIVARKRWARRTLIAFEVADIALGVAIWLAVAAATGDPELTGAVIAGSSLGLLIAAALIGLVRTPEMEQWCDRSRNNTASGHGRRAEPVRR
ncbi:hypothetical protein [Glycomyces xiaoerkulensis]|uniref:hypothetical protein n=1 Tax=Glycomyces xiaoerkulensis TaxID=2038139 RepID=UPI000C265BBD|nr:hypothetical protein [Glycomyces xiaoerkulensis]